MFSRSNFSHQLWHEIPGGNRQNSACIDKKTHKNCAISPQAHRPRIDLLLELDTKVITANDWSHPSDQHQSNMMKKVLNTMVKREHIGYGHDVSIEDSYMSLYPEPS